MKEPVPSKTVRVLAAGPEFSDTIAVVELDDDLESVERYYQQRRYSSKVVPFFAATNTEPDKFETLVRELRDAAQERDTDLQSVWAECWLAVENALVGAEWSLSAGISAECPRGTFEDTARQAWNIFGGRRDVVLREFEFKRKRIEQALFALLED